MNFRWILDGFCNIYMDLRCILDGCLMDFSDFLIIDDVLMTLDGCSDFLDVDLM